MKDVVQDLIDNFVHLHVHTYYSLLDGGASPEMIVQEAKAQGFKAIAVTEHGNMTSHIEFYDACKEAGIKPIIGNELYFTYDINIPAQEYPQRRWDKKNYHLIVLAKNQTGYHNLIKLSSVAAIKGLYDGKPRCDLALLKEYSEGLIVSSACLGGIIQARIGDWYLACNDPDRFKEVLYKRMSWKDIVPKTTGRGKKKVTTYTDEELVEIGLREEALNPEVYEKEAEKYILAFKEIFKEDFYLELQTTTEPLQRIVNLKLIEYAEKFDVKLIITCDVHYAKAEDHDFHDSVTCVSMKKLKSDENRMKYKECYYVMPETDVYEYLDYLPLEIVTAAVKNTAIIANQCDVEIKYGSIPFPDPGIPKGMSAEKYLEELTYKGLFKYSLTHPEIDVRKYRAQIDHELEVINNSGFASYFLVVRDYIEASNEECSCPTGPGRGSGAGSIVTYLNGITRNVDPIKNGLLFERFLNPERIEMPDIDTDFEYMHRQDLIGYLYNKYGRDCVSRIMTITREGIKTAIKDAGRVLGYEPAVINALTKQLPVLDKDDVDIEDEDDYNGDKITPEVAKVLETIKHEYSDIYDLAMRLYGMPRNYGMHASGVLISGTPIMDSMPQKAVKDKVTGEINIVTQFDHGPVEKLGGIKFDILGLKTLSVLQYAITLTGKEIDLSTIDFDDPQIYDLVQSGTTEGIFQMESGLFKRLCRDVVPTCFNDISALVALGRPGPLQSGIVESYIKRKKGLEEVDYEFDIMKDDLEESFGTYIYQEQIIMAGQKISGFSLGQADLGLRKPIAKKNMALINENRTYFVHGKSPCPNPPGANGKHKDCTICNGTGYVGNEDTPDKETSIIPGGIEMGFDEDDLNSLYDKFIFYGEYCFNKSHSACYAVIACQTMYMKTYYPVEFMAALISFAPDTDKIGFYINHCKDIGIKVLMPDINKSVHMCTVEDGCLRLGFSLIKGVSGGSQYIINEREANGEFKDFTDFYTRVNKTKVNKSKFVALINSGCFVSLDNRNIHSLYNGYLDLKSDKKEERLSVIISRKEFMEYESDLFGTNIIYVSDFQRRGNGEKVEITGTVIALRVIQDRNKNDMAFIKVETSEDEIECVVFSGTYAKAKAKVQIGKRVQINGKKDSNKMIVNSISYDVEESA